MTSKTTMVLEINELKAKLKAKDEEFNKILEQEEDDLEQLITDFQNEGYELIDFVKDFITVRRERIEEIKQRIKEEWQN